MEKGIGRHFAQLKSDALHMTDRATYLPVARACFVAYGALVGLAYALLLNRAFAGDLLSGAVLFFVLGTAFALLSSKFRPAQGTRLWQSLVMIPLIPFALAAEMFVVALVSVVLVAMLGATFPFFAVRQYWHDRNFKRAMMRDGRYISHPQLREHLAKGEGTLLEETGTKGPYRIWWTADDVLAFGSPIDDPEVWLAVLYEGKQHAFNSYCVANYLDDSKGTALLTSIRPRIVTSGKIGHLFPKAKRATVIRPLPVDRTVDFA